MTLSLPRLPAQSSLPKRPKDPSRLSHSLRNALAEIARTGLLLVACDYDGTLAPIVENPTQARPLPQAVDVLRRLAALPATDVAVVSGRALRDLAAMSRLPAEVTLVGSHGAEFDLGSIHGMDAARTALRDKVTAQCARVIADVPGAQLEIKPAGVAVHTRTASKSDAARIQKQLIADVATWDNVYLTRGKEVLDFAVIHADKGTAVEHLSNEHAATAVIFVGDDVTDERVFGLLQEHDVGVKVGKEDTAAHYRVHDPQDVIELLSLLAELRHAWLAGANAIPIEDHALLGDGTDVALLTPDGSVNWLCHPGPGSPAIFSGLLGDANAGHLAVRPAHGGRPLSVNYIDSTMVVQTKWAGVTVTDYLDRTFRTEPGRESQLRLIRAISGTAPVVVSFAPRPQFGAVPVKLKPVAAGILVTGSSDQLVLVAPGLEWAITKSGPHQTATATVDPSKGDVVIELRAGTDNMSIERRPEPERREITIQYWRYFVSRLHSPPGYAEVVKRSALILKSMCYAPTGAAIAAATTSLPEWLGGGRNWDYRYCWLRDAAMTVHALSSLGSTAEADAYIVWLANILDAVASPERVHPLYSLDGNTLGPEAVIDTLPGYAGSRPVRIGNAAQGQVQLDVFGPICAMIAATVAVRGVTSRDLEVVNACVEAVKQRWKEADHGIWEIRDDPRHNTHSRVMCWQAIDQAIAVIGATNSTRPDWEALRDEIATDILTHGWNPDVNSFVSAYGRTDVDAAALCVINAGLLPADDPRCIGTIRAVEAMLRDGPTVYRYRYDDGLPGTEGGMHICTTWLIEAYAAAGMIEEARNLFDQLLACAGRTGLLPEMHDPNAGRGLGNHPQAYSHLGLIRCALVLAKAQDERAPKQTAS